MNSPLGYVISYSNTGAYTIKSVTFIISFFYVIYYDINIFFYYGLSCFCFNELNPVFINRANISLGAYYCVSHFSFFSFLPLPFDFSFLPSSFNDFCVSLCALFLSSCIHSIFPSPGCLIVRLIFGSSALKLIATILAMHESPFLRLLFVVFPTSVLVLLKLT